MLSKEKFVNIINRLRKYSELQNNIQKLFEDSIDNKEMDFMNAGSICIGHETIVVSLLENIFDDKEIISWWIYDLDYGRKYESGCITEIDGTTIEVSTPEKLYDYLIETKKEVEG